MTTTLPAADGQAATTPRFDYVSVHDVYAALAGGGGFSVAEYPRGEITEAAKLAEPKEAPGMTTRRS